MPKQRNVLIVTVADDLHALIVRDCLEADGDISCNIIECNRLSGADGLEWSSDETQGFLPVLGGKTVDLSKIDLIWWRRSNFPQTGTSHLNEIQRDLVDADCKAALLGTVLTKFKGIWINHPTATALAENKLLQLSIAREVGFHVPRTLVSQNPDAIRRFCSSLNNEVVAKPIKGTQLMHLFTRKVTAEHLSDDSALRACPTIFQELVRGETHLRVQCFGESAVAVAVTSNALDWREDLTIPFEPRVISVELHELLRRTLDRLRLRMGIVDLKIDEQGRAIWLEINPQGQFLFAEALSGVDLKSAFVSFLRGELTSATMPRQMHAS